jgi:flagellar hook-basal body complex protein FliE
MNNTIFTGLPVPPVTRPTSPTTPGGVGEEGGFGSVLKGAMEQVGELNQDAQHQIGELLQGDRQDIHNVMIAVEKADVTFQLMMQLRNKIVNAYQEISKMQF